ncbi:MAG: porin [Porphyrobacter sp.]|nr:porin [Porphyrobacter sp.]
MCFALPAAACAQDAEDGAPVFTLESEYVLDLVGVAQGEGEGVRHVDLLSITGELDLDAATGWRGARLVGEVIAGTGGQPNLLAGTLQGIDNAEVSQNRVKLYQFYLTQQLAELPVTLSAGFIDLNAQFYANDAAGLLLAPAFGIGSELAATGPNGPAIFPSTALTAMFRAQPAPDTYTAFAVVNAEAGVLGDRGGMAPVFDEGALLIGEAGVTRFGKVALGAWTYTRRQDDIRLVDEAGEPLRRRAQGAYLLLEWPLARGDRDASMFARAGISDGDTTPYSGGWQAGVLIDRVLPGRPSSQFSLGANQAFLTGKFRRNEADAGIERSGRETGFEITLADTLAPWLTVQGDAQYVRNSARGEGARDAVVLGLRFILATGSAW